MNRRGVINVYLLHFACALSLSFAHILILTLPTFNVLLIANSSPEGNMPTLCLSSDDTTDDEILRDPFPLKVKSKRKLSCIVPQLAPKKKTLKEQAESNYFVLQEDLSNSCSSMYEFRIRGHPRAWKRAAPNRVKRLYNPNKDYQLALKSKIKELFEMNDRRIERISGMSLKLSILFYFPKPKTLPGNVNGMADIDNLAKLVLDAFSKLFYKDDGQVCTLFLQKRFGLTESGHMYVSIKEDQYVAMNV